MCKKSIFLPLKNLWLKGEETAMRIGKKGNWSCMENNLLKRDISCFESRFPLLFFQFQTKKKYSCLSTFMSTSFSSCTNPLQTKHVPCRCIHFLYFHIGSSHCLAANLSYCKTAKESAYRKESFTTHIGEPVPSLLVAEGHKNCKYNFKMQQFWFPDFKVQIAFITIIIKTVVQNVIFDFVRL